MTALLCVSSVAAFGAALDDDAVVEGEYLRVVVSPGAGGGVSEFGLCATVGNFAGEGGLLQEGFGVASFYVPNRRLNERLEILESITDRPVLRYSYDCDGPNIRGIHVTRTLEPIPDEASLRVRWRIENKGDERQWIAPWVRNDIAPGGKGDSRDRIDVPTFKGIIQPDRPAHYPASRNWIAVTDPIEKISVYGVFNADSAYSFLPLREPEGTGFGFQASFVPRLIGPGKAWETTYRINAVRGLKHVDFATDEIAAQLDYKTGKLELLIATAKILQDVRIYASVIAENGRVWRLSPRRFDIDPNRVIRCSFEWFAPGDGVYDFLAQLKHGNGEPIDLGKDTAPPHGGIDTQFVVGKAGKTRMAPWTDTPFALERGPRKPKRSMACAGDTAIWFENALDKVFQEDVPEPDGWIDRTARIALARNERESFQIVIRPPKDERLFNVSFRLNDLVDKESGAKIGAENIRTFNVAYCPVRVPSHFEGPTGNWPDALPPFKPFTAEGGQCRPVWFTVYAPPETPAGTYVGTLELLWSGARPIPLLIEATVYDFDLPRTPALKTDFGYWEEAALAMGRDHGCALSAPDLNRLYLENALEHRVTLRELVHFPGPSEGYAAVLDEFETRIEQLMDRGATTFSVPLSLVESPECLMQVNAFAVNSGLLDRVFCQVADEPIEPAWPQLVERMYLWHATAPDLPLMVTTFGLRPFIPEALHIWAVHTPIFDTLHNRTLLERIQQGGDVWWYVNHAPPRPYGNFFVDFSALEHRILFWQTWALGIKGFHYWSVNYCEPGRDPYDGLADVTPVNGDGFLVYPGAAGPVSSIRWEVIRDGIEDFDYITLLRDRMRSAREAGGQEALLERARKALDLKELVPDLVSFSRDPRVLLDKRREIAQMILELGKALP